MRILALPVILPLMSAAAEDSSSGSLFLFVCLLAVDYAWCFLLVGWPAIAWTSLRIREMALEMLWLTLVIQPAALVGTLLANLLIHVLDPGSGDKGEAGFVLSHSILHFLLGGIAVGLVIWHFECRRWGLSRGLAWTLTLVGAALVNPVFGGYALANLV